MPSRAAGPARAATVVVVAALGTVLVVPVVAAALVAWGRSWVPAGDWAMLELAVSDTGTSATRLVGPYSRLGWSHPGPLLFWTLAPLWRATGGAAWSLLVGAAALNLAALGAVLALAWRRGRLPLLAFVVLGVVWVVASLDEGLLADPWNPWVVVLALAAVVLGVAGAVEGDGWALVVAVVAGTLCAQSHVGAVPVVAAVWAVGGVWAWRRGVLSSRWWGWGAAVPLGVLWAPVALDAVAGRGNAWNLVTDAGAGAADPTGWERGLEVVARQLAWGGPWRGGDEPISAVDGAVLGRPLAGLVVPVAVFALALALGVWRRSGSAVRLQVVVGVAAVAGVVAVSRIDGPAYAYLLRWWWSLAALWWASAAWTLWQVAADAWRRVEVRRDGPVAPRAATASRVARAWAPVVLGVVVVAVAAPVAAGTVERVRTDPAPNAALAGLVTDATDATLDALGAPGSGEAGVVEVWSGGEGAGWVVDPVSVALERAGWEVVVPRTPMADGKWGTSRTRPLDEFTWFPRPGAGPDGRRAVWVLGDGGTPVVAPAAPSPTLVFADDTGVDGAPVAVWVG